MARRSGWMEGAARWVRAGDGVSARRSTLGLTLRRMVVALLAVVGVGATFGEAAAQGQPPTAQIVVLSVSTHNEIRNNSPPVPRFYDTKFDAIDVSMGSETKSYCIANPGDAHLQISSFVVSGDVADFTVSGPTATRIPAGTFALKALAFPEYCFDVTFDPVTPGRKTATITIESNGVVPKAHQAQRPVPATGTFILNVGGSGIDDSGDPQIIVMDTTRKVLTNKSNGGGGQTSVIDIGERNIGSNRTEPVFLVENGGPGPLRIQKIEETGSAALRLAPPWLNRLEKGSYGFVSVKVNPTTAGKHTTTFKIHSNDPTNNRVFEFDVVVTGVKAATKTTIDKPPAPSRANQPYTVSVKVEPQRGTGTPTGTVTVSDGASGTCEVTLNAQSRGRGSCQLTTQNPDTVTLTATYSGDGTFAPSTGTVQHRVNGRAPASLQSMIVVGASGVLPTIVSGEPASLANHQDFGEVTIGQGPQTRTFHILNYGGGPLNLIGQLSIAQGGSADFTIVQPRTRSLPSNDPTKSIPFQIAFNPTTPGDHAAVLLISSNDPHTREFRVNLKGEARRAPVIPPPEPEIKITGNGQEIRSGSTSSSTDNHTDFGTVQVNGGTATRTFTVENTGAAPLTLGRLANGRDFSIVQQLPSTVQPGDHASFTVRFAPTAVGARTAKLKIANNDSDENPYTFVIGGEGVKAGSTTTITADTPDPSPIGGSYQVSVAVAAAAGLTGTPGGEVVISDGQSNSCRAKLANGAGSCTLTGTPPGLHELRADYPGDRAFAASFAREPHEVGAGAGTIAIAVSTSPRPAGNATFRYAASDPGLHGLSITTVNNRGQSDNILKAAGRYRVQQAELTGWRLKSVSCGGDLDDGSRVDLANRQVTIDLDSSESIVCTFLNVRDEAYVRARTKAVIGNFMSRRADQLTANDPDLVDRLRGTVSGGNASPFDFTASGTRKSHQMSFGIGLNQIRAAQRANQAKRIANLGGVQAVVPGRPSFADSKLDVWAAGRWASSETDETGHSIGLVYLGLDYRFTPGLLVGVMAQHDWADEKDDREQFAVKGRGWLAGPYVVARLGRNAIFDGRVAWGQSRNKVNPLGSYEDTFNTERWLARARLTGDFQWGEVSFMPHVGVIYFSETQKAYRDSLGIAIPGQTVSLGRLTFGPRFKYNMSLADGTVIVPEFGVKGIWDFDKADRFDLTTGLATGEGGDLRARVEAALTVQMTNGWSLQGEGFYDGLGAGGYQSYGGGVNLRLPLQRASDDGLK